MNVESFISSGILESYVMDHLLPAERMEVERLAATYPEIREELAQIELLMEAVALSTAIEPPTGSRDEILKSLNRPKEEEAPIIPINRTGLFMRYAAAASVVIALGSVLLAFSFWNKWQSAEEELAVLIAENQQFADNYNQVNQQLDNIREAVEIMNSSAYRRVQLGGTENAPNSLATVYWNDTSEEVYLSIQNLRQLAENQQYQLWAIIDGKPVDAGVFDPDEGEILLAMNKIGGGAAAFAITIEPRGGSENPSLQTMQVIGNV